jgi:hypothetical protein
MVLVTSKCLKNDLEDLLEGKWGQSSFVQPTGVQFNPFFLVCVYIIDYSLNTFQIENYKNMKYECTLTFKQIIIVNPTSLCLFACLSYLSISKRILTNHFYSDTKE